MNKIYKAFPDGKHKVLTFSYDDGKFADRRLVSIFNKYGMKGTFNLNTHSDMPEVRIPSDEWTDLYAGHEIALHTDSHPTIARCPSNEIYYEFIENKIGLEAITGYPVRGLAYPNGSSSSETVHIAKSLGIQYGRVAADQYSAVKAAKQYSADAEGPILLGDATGFNLPDNYDEWVPTCHHNHNLMEFGNEFLKLFKKQYLYCMYVWGHSFEFDKNDNWHIIEDFCSMMSNQDDIWYATNIEIVDNDTVFKNLQFSADNTFVYNPSFASAWICVNNDNVVEIKGGQTVAL